MKLEYDSVSPITGNECVIIEADEKTGTNSYMCMESGYTTTDNFKIDSEHVETYETQITELMKNIKFEDKETGLVWYPAFLNIPGAGMLYCKGETKENMTWEVADIIELIGEERLNYPVPGKEGEYFTSKLNTENATSFLSKEFDKALDHFYSIVNKVYAQ